VPATPVDLLSNRNLGLEESARTVDNEYPKAPRASPRNHAKESELTEESVTERKTPPDIVLASLLGDGAEHAEIGLFIYDDDGKYVAINRFGAELLGYDRGELLEHDVGDFTAGGIDRDLLLRLEQREGVRIVQRKDGTERTVAFVVTPTQVGSFWFYFAVVWELTPDDPRATAAY
jgi:PAS domain S-box-containing protein